MRSPDKFQVGEAPIIKSLAIAMPRLAAVCLCGMLGPGQVLAGPWIFPNNPAVRNDVDLLAESGALTVPVTTWPLSAGDISNALESIDASKLSPDQQAAVMRLRRTTRQEKITGKLRRQVSVSVSDESPAIRGFTTAPRERTEASASIDWMVLGFSYRLKMTAVADASDGRTLRADGSHVGVTLGNFMLSAGQVDRWWGPGWDGSLIMSTNARPLPAVALQRNLSEAPSSRWLSWIGPWSFVSFMGQLEHNRAIADALVFGMRVSFRPRKNLEIGLSRTAQWCGDTRPCDIQTFADLLRGKDNRGDDVTFENEPGNQLAGIDWRWTPARGWTWYGQLIGEDEAGGLPSRHIAMSGLTARAFSERWNSNLAWHLEYADTTVEFYKNRRGFDTAYEHGIYRDGYRYRGRPIGHTFDNDTRLLSLGLTWHGAGGDYWKAVVRHAEMNTGGMRANSVSVGQADRYDIEVNHLRDLKYGQLSVGLRFSDTEIVGDDDSNIQIYTQWQGEL